MQVLRVCAFCAFSAPPAFPPCYCPLAFRHQVRRLTSRISSESHPGSQECVTNYHGAEECTCVHHTIHPVPTPLDASRDIVPSRFGCQSDDCGYFISGLLTARYLAAVPPRILLMEQQVWSILARQSTLRPRVAAPAEAGGLVLWTESPDTGQRPVVKTPCESCPPDPARNDASDTLGSSLPSSVRPWHKNTHVPRSAVPSSASSASETPRTACWRCGL
jgi:hypothetical protein